MARDVTGPLAPRLLGPEAAMALAALGVVAAFFLASPISAAPPAATLRGHEAATSACRAATPHAVAACRVTARARNEAVALGLSGRQLRFRCAASWVVRRTGHRVASGASGARRDRREVSVACALTRLAPAP